MVQPTENAALLDALVNGYDVLGRRLARALNSIDQAGDALQETFVKLRCAGDVGHVRSPQAFLFRVALNLARDSRRADARRLSSREIDDLTEIEDEAPCPAKRAEARSSLALFSSALNEMPPRRRAILEASLIEDAPRRDIARRFDVSERTIDFELKKALQHARDRLREEI